MLFIGALGVMSAAANWFALGSLHRIDRINAMISEEVEPSRLILTETKIAVGWMGLATYKMAATTDPDTVREANDERAGNMPRPRPGSTSWPTICPAIARTWRECAEGSTSSIR